jgi:hypothetical protein
VFYWESARLKMQESALDDSQSLAIKARNVAGLLA